MRVKSSFQIFHFFKKWNIYNALLFSRDLLPLVVKNSLSVEMTAFFN